MDDSTQQSGIPEVPKSWIGRMVRARIRTRRGGQYLLLGTLVEVNEKGIKIVATSPSGAVESLQAARHYAWDSVVGVEPCDP